MAVEDFMKPERVIIGTSNSKTRAVLDQLYEPFVRSGNPIYFMDERSAEMTKYAANSFLATKISFMNEIANLCELTGAEVDKVRIGIGSDSRIGKRFLFPGVGYGGSCFPKDIRALIRTAEDKGYSMKILNAVDEVNNAQKEVLFHKILRHFNGNIENRIISIWGLSFKPSTDDMRDAPSLTIINKLLEQKAKVVAYDPVAMDECRRRIGERINYSRDRYEALIDSDALVVITEWPEFRLLNYRVMEKLMKNKVIFDGRNIYDPSEMKEYGFIYYGIGRRSL